jgi:hypothetical protein
MRNALLFLLLRLGLLSIGCGRTDATGGLHNDPSTCGHAADVDSTAPGACETGRAQLSCTFASGAGCDCVTDDTSCEGCGPNTSATCVNKCTANEYAVACGGPPPPNGSFTYAAPPAGCRGLSFGPGGGGFYCCPCQ